MNHETYDERLALVKAILNDFNLEVSKPCYTKLLEPT